MVMLEIIKTANKKHLVLAIFITTLGFLLNLRAYYPGFLSPDSLDQYQQALTHRFSTWHPPIMAGFWSLLLKIHPGGVLMFLLQISVFWISFLILSLTFLKHSTKFYFLVPLLFFAPFIQNFVGNIWKDVGLAISWLLAIAIMLHTFYEKRSLNKLESIICFMLLCYGCWIRINALPGVIPLLGMFVYCRRKDVRFNMPLKKLYLNMVGLTLLVLGLQIGITKIILKPSHTFPEYKLFVHDLSGIFIKTKHLYFPDYIKNYEGFDTVYLKKKYIYSTFDNIWWNTDNKRIIPDANAEQMLELQKCWINAILKHPMVYLKNRITGFLQFLRITKSGSGLAITYFYIHPNEFGLEFHPNKLSTLLHEYIEIQRPMPYMQPWFWLLLNLLILLAVQHPRLIKCKWMVLFLAYSSLLYIALEFIVYQADTEFRYFYWNFIAISLAIIMMVVDFYKKPLEADKQFPEEKKL